MTTMLPGALIVKEGRALAPIWLGAALTMVAGTQAGMLMGALLAFIFGAAALGVFSIGHEYANRTLTSLLAQPLSRPQLLLSKVLVLVALLLLLSVTAAFVLLRAEGVDRMLGGGTVAAQWRLLIVALTPLLGLCVAPWLTMLFRNATAGLVFTLALPAALWIAGQIARAASVDFDFTELAVRNPFTYEPTLALLAIGMLVASAIAVVHGRMLFLGLEALDTPRDLPAWAIKRRRVPPSAANALQRTALHRRHPLLLFVQKELHLYALTFALGALYAIGWIALWLARADTYLADTSFELAAAMYGVFVALLIGSISVAEERALGTADAQILQPWSFWKLWLAKLGTAGLLSLLLGLALPRVLQALLPLVNSSRAVGPDLGPLRFLLPNALNGGGAAVLLTVLFSCYVSTLCVGGLRALLTALPLSFGVIPLFVSLLYAVDRFQYNALAGWYGPRGRAGVWKLATATGADFRLLFQYSQWTSAALFIGLVALLMMFFARNFKSGERGTSMAIAQIPRLFVYFLCAAVLIRGGAGVLEWWLFTH